jgi:hypothetical protein
MSTSYNPEIKMYYGPMDEDHRLVPSPDINISVEYYYSNDTMAGYTYIINLNGNVTAADMRDDNPKRGPAAIMDRLYKIRKILSQNGNKLHVIKTNPNDLL